MSLFIGDKIVYVKTDNRVNKFYYVGETKSKNHISFLKRLIKRTLQVVYCSALRSLHFKLISTKNNLIGFHLYLYKWIKARSVEFDKFDD